MFRLSVAVISAAAISLAIAPVALAQSSGAPAKDETVRLSEFRVSTTQSSPYKADEANSAGRVRMSLLDTPQSVTVITRDFMDDIGTGRALDAAKFSAGVTESQFPNRLDRMTVRGFQQDAAQQSQFLDGFRFSAISAGYNSDAANLERLEIVKGPNAIIAAAGSPGGSINFITKSPKFTSSGYVKLQLGEYLANRLELDSTGALPWLGGKFMAYRVVGLYADGEGYQENQFAINKMIAPSLTLAFSPDTELTIKGYVWEGDVAGLNLPLDPRIGIGDTPKIYPGLRRTFSSTGGKKPNIPGSQQRVIAELTHKFAENFQARLGVMAAKLRSDAFFEAIRGNSLGNAVGNANSFTGIYTPGTTWTVLNYGLPTQMVTSVAAAFPDFSNRTAGYTYNLDRGFNTDKLLAVQNDYVYNHVFSPTVRSSTVAGISINVHQYDQAGYLPRSTPLVGSIDNPDYNQSYANATALPAVQNSRLDERETTGQVFVSEVLHLFNDRLIASASVSYFDYKQTISPDSIFTNNPVGRAVPVPASLGFVGNAVYPTAPYDVIKGNRTNLSLGLVYKPVKNVSIFYGQSENANPPTLNNIGGTATQAQYGSQYEFGSKASLFDGKFDVSLTYFNLTQHNVFVYDVITKVFLPLGDVTSKGYELEASARITPEITFIGAASAYKAREGFGRRLRSVPDQSGAVALKYQFNAGPLKSLWLMVAADYMDKRAGDIPGGININAATAKPGTVVGTVNGRALNGNPVEPTFYLPERTMVNLTGGYTFNAQWRLWFKVENLLNKDVIYASLNRGVLAPSAPLNVTGSVTYRF